MNKFRVSTKQKKLRRFHRSFSLIIGRRLTLPDFTPVPSARVVLTSLFGMGRGGPHRNSHLKNVGNLFGGVPHRPDSYRDHLKVFRSNVSSSMFKVGISQLWTLDMQL